MTQNRTNVMNTDDWMRIKPLYVPHKTHTHARTTTHTCAFRATVTTWHVAQTRKKRHLIFCGLRRLTEVNEESYFATIMAYLLMDLTMEIQNRTQLSTIFFFFFLDPKRNWTEIH